MQRYIKWIIKQPSCAPLGKRNPQGQIVPCHQRLPGTCGVSKKPPDTYALPLTYHEHQDEHRGDKTFWKGTDRAELIVKHIVRYLDEKENVDGWRLAAELLTGWMKDNCN